VVETVEARSALKWYGLSRNAAPIGEVDAMFVAGKMFADPREAKAWVEATVTFDERRHWIVLELEGDDPPEPKVIKGLSDGSIIVNKSCKPD
jgi:hypothetical protein